jgi:hypothetical protein
VLSAVAVLILSEDAVLILSEDAVLALSEDAVLVLSEDAVAALGVTLELLLVGEPLAVSPVPQPQRSKAPTKENETSDNTERIAIFLFILNLPFIILVAVRNGLGDFEPDGYFAYLFKSRQSPFSGFV